MTSGLGPTAASLRQSEPRYAQAPGPYRADRSETKDLSLDVRLGSLSSPVASAQPAKEAIVAAFRPKALLPFASCATPTASS